MNGIEHNARLEPWQFFVTLTFLDPVPGLAARQKMLVAWLRVICERKGKGGSLQGIHFHRLLWLARSERGEATGRVHFHVLLNGLPVERVNPVECYAQQAAWEKLGGGIARVRMYAARHDGVSYTLKGLKAEVLAAANDYELAKFSGSEDTILIVSHSLFGKWQGSVSRGEGSRAHRLPKSRRCDITAARGPVRSIPRVTTRFQYPQDL